MRSNPNKHVAYINVCLTLEEILVKEKKSTVEKPLEEIEEIEIIEKVSIQQLANKYTVLLTFEAPTPQNGQALKQFVGFCRRIVWVCDHFVGLVLIGFKNLD